MKRAARKKLAADRVRRAVLAGTCNTVSLATALDMVEQTLSRMDVKDEDGRRWHDLEHACASRLSEIVGMRL